MPTRKQTTTIETKPNYRAVAIDAGALTRAEGDDDDDRVVDLAFSSETPVKRFFGIEILDHEKASIRLDWLASGRAPLLLNHDHDTQIGVIESVTIGDDRIGRARVRFSKGVLGSEVLADIRDGIRANVSVGYDIHRILREEIDGDDETFRAVDWEPFEISIVTVPADQLVGVGRSGDGVKSIKTTVIDEAAGEGDPADDQDGAGGDETRTGADEPSPADDPIEERGQVMSEDDKNNNGADAVDVAKIQSDARDAEVTRIREIEALGRDHKLDQLATKAIQAGESVDQFRATVLKEISARAGNPVDVAIADDDPEIGMSDKDLKRYSLVRLLACLANPGEQRFRDAAGFELECSRAVSDKLKSSPQGAYMPTDVMRQPVHAEFKRDMVVGTASAGGNLVSTDLLAMSFIEILRNKMVLMRAGATMLTDLVGNLAIPKQTGGATAYWITSEGGVPSESTPAIGQVTLAPKTVGAYTDISRQLLLQSSIDVEAFVRRDLATVLALAVDLAGLSGSGSSGQPQGVKTVTGVNTQDFATASQPTYAELVGMETAIAADNADVSAMTYITDPTIRGHAKTTEKASGSGQFIWEPGNTINGYPAEITNQVTAGDVYFGNWADLLIGMWGGLDVLIDPYTGGTAGTVRVIEHQSVDVAVRHAESFCHGNDSY